jgi:hypothetical protein
MTFAEALEQLLGFSGHDVAVDVLGPTGELLAHLSGRQGEAAPGATADYEHWLIAVGDDCFYSVSEEQFVGADWNRISAAEYFEVLLRDGRLWIEFDENEATRLARDRR